MTGGLIKPKKLKAGDTIGVMSPSSFMLLERLETGVAQLRSYGFNVYIHQQCYARYHGAAGTTDEKIAALHELFSDSSINAVMTTRGGSRSSHMLDGIDYDLIRRNPKLFIGFSDITALLSAFYVRSNLSGVHAAQLAYFDPKKELISADLLMQFVQGNWVDNLWPQDYPKQVLQEGDVTGELYGGNLSLLTALLAAGDRYVPDMTGKILVIEDIDEDIRVIDRMIGAMRLRGIFNQISALVVGQMTDVKDTASVPFDRSIASVVFEHASAVKGPIIVNAPIGHEHPNVPFPIGIRARLTAETNGGAQLQLMESPFADA